MLSEITKKSKTHTVRSHLYVKSKKAKLMKTEEWWVPGTGAWGDEEMLAKGSKFPVIRDVSSGNLLYSR